MSEQRILQQNLCKDDGVHVIRYIYLFIAMQAAKYLETGEEAIACNYYDIVSYNKMSSEHILSLFHHNSRSLNKNLDDITTFTSLLKEDFSVIGFTETWLTADISPLIHINNYTLVERHRPERRGGGVCLFVNNDLNFKLRNDISIFNDSVNVHRG